jgi:hypothetical protein
VRGQMFREGPGFEPQPDQIFFFFVFTYKNIYAVIIIASSKLLVFDYFCSKLRDLVSDFSDSKSIFSASSIARMSLHLPNELLLSIADKFEMRVVSMLLLVRIVSCIVCSTRIYTNITSDPRMG